MKMKRTSACLSLLIIVVLFNFNKNSEIPSSDVIYVATHYFSLLFPFNQTRFFQSDY